LALSYALQSHFDIRKALAVIAQAIKPNKRNALLWARLSELHLMSGNLNKAIHTALQANKYTDTLHQSLNNRTLGFAYLARIEISKAERAFNKAIGENDADPLSRLGLGLALIRKGDLQQGRRQLEFAASLDPNNALIRSYLGKAYYEENRNTLSATQFSMAKELDANDPTAYFYDALRKHSANRPIEALADLHKSIELNDNRAIYRSKLLLDQDFAARGASLARIYDDLGFNQAAKNIASESTRRSPADHSAHRFLSDVFAAKTRFASASASELLQAQLLQPINVNPVQPQATETNLNLPNLSEPSRLGFNEFSPLFVKEKARLTGFFESGSDKTFSDEIVLSGIYGNTSYSVGQFHYETDGFREGADIEHDLYNVFLQSQVSERVNIQLEYRKRETDQGDLRLNFDPNFIPSERRLLQKKTARLGLHIKTSSNSNFLVSGIKTEQDGDSSVTFPVGSVGSNINTEGSDYQTQYIFHSTNFSWIAGLGHYDVEVQTDIRQIFNGIEFPPNIDNTDVRQSSAYLYWNHELSDTISTTVGFSYEDLNEGLVDIDNQFYIPKFGLQWHPTSRLNFRFAAFKTLKRLQPANQTLEPSQIVGFNQFFDDFNASEARVYGLGVDLHQNSNIQWGYEYIKREIERPLTTANATSTEELDENSHRLYYYHNLTERLSLSSELEWDNFKSDTNNLKELETAALPLRLVYTHPSGWQTELGVSYLQQKLTEISSLTLELGQLKEDVTLFDVKIEYKLPKRKGVISLVANNIFNKVFLYQDLRFFSSDNFAAETRFLPTRAVTGRILFYFN